MKPLNEFIIPYLGLSNGMHHYNFEIGSNFFAHFEKSKISDGKFELSLDLIKDGRMVVLMISCHGFHLAPCDRCLSKIKIPMRFEDKLIIKIEEEKAASESDVYYLDPGTSHIDLSPLLYESLHLNLPIKNVRDCESEGNISCDLKALKSLEGTSEENVETDSGNVWQILDELKIEKDKD